MICAFCLDLIYCAPYVDRLMYPAVGTMYLVNKFMVDNFCEDGYVWKLKANGHGRNGRIESDWPHMVSDLFRDALLF